MENSFYDFWRLYAPQAAYHNRYRACERLWSETDELRRRRIIHKLEEESAAGTPHTANPYFYLIRADPQPEWLTPAQTGRLLAQRVPLAVAFDCQTRTYRTTTRTEAEAYGLQVHHYM